MKLTKLQNDIIAEFTKRSGINVELGIDKLKMWVEVNEIDHNIEASGGGMGTNGISEYLFYCPDNMPSRKQELSYAIAILFHEMAHATQHKDRVIRDFTDWTGNMEEVIAEMTAKKLSIHFDIITPRSRELHNTYIESWSNWLSRDELWLCMEYSDKCMKYILDNWLIDLNDRLEAA